MPRRPFPRLRMRSRRAWFWLTGIRWWAVLALLVGALTAAVAFAGGTTPRVLGCGVVAVVLAILATREEP